MLTGVRRSSLSTVRGHAAVIGVTRLIQLILVNTALPVDWLRWLLNTGLALRVILGYYVGRTLFEALQVTHYLLPLLPKNIRLRPRLYYFEYGLLLPLVVHQMPRFATRYEYLPPFTSLRAIVTSSVIVSPLVYTLPVNGSLYVRRRMPHWPPLGQQLPAIATTIATNITVNSLAITNNSGRLGLASRQWHGQRH